MNTENPHVTCPSCFAEYDKLDAPEEHARATDAHFQIIINAARFRELVSTLQAARIQILEGNPDSALRIINNALDSQAKV